MEHSAKQNPELSRRAALHEIVRLNRVVHPIWLGEAKDYVLSDNEGQVLRIRIFPNTRLARRWQLRMEARKSLQAEVSIYGGELEIGQVKRLRPGSTFNWVVFSLPEGRYTFRFRRIPTE